MGMAMPGDEPGLNQSAPKNRGFGKGSKHSEETRAKMRAAHLGRGWSITAKATISARDWEARDIGSKHYWVSKNFVDPGMCEDCGVTLEQLKFRSAPMDWASIGHTYTKDRKDWARLCRSCHQKLDRRSTRAKPWERTYLPIPEGAIW